MEKGVKQGKGSYPLLSMKKDQANKTNVEGVKTHIKFQQSLVKSRLVSNMEHSTKPGRVRCELNLCVGSPVTEAYRKSDEVSESSRSYVGDGQRLCIKHREFLQNDNRKKARK